MSSIFSQQIFRNNRIITTHPTARAVVIEPCAANKAETQVDEYGKETMEKTISDAVSVLKEVD